MSYRRPVGALLVLGLVQVPLLAAVPSPTSVAEPVRLRPDPAKGAAALARRAHDPKKGPAAVAAILTRSGIAILDARAGAITNRPVAPMLVDVSVYDFEVPILARAVHDQRAWTLGDLGALPAVTGTGDALDARTIAAVLPTWVANATGDPGGEDAFAALVSQQLARLHDPAEDLTAITDPATLRLDPLQLTLMAASLYSRSGTITATKAHARTAGKSAPLAEGLNCDDLKQLTDDPTGLSKKYGKKILGKILSVLVNDKFGKAVGTVIDKVGITEDGIAALLMLAGVQLQVTDDTGQKIHYAHEHKGVFYKYTATLRFDSDAPDSVVRCGGLAGFKVPPSGPLKGWLISWNLEQDGPHVQPVEGEGNKQERVPGGVGGEKTGSSGTSTFRVEVSQERACPGKFCGKGKLKTGSATGIAKADPGPNLPKLSDLIGVAENPVAGGTKTIGKLLLDLMTRIGMPEGRDTVVVERHVQSAMAHAMVSAGGVTIEFTAKACDVEGPWTATKTITGPVNWTQEFEWTLPPGGGTTVAHQTSGTFPLPAGQLSISQTFTVSLGGPSNAPTLELGPEATGATLTLNGFSSSASTAGSPHSIPVTFGNVSGCPEK